MSPIHDPPFDGPRRRVYPRAVERATHGQRGGGVTEGAPHVRRRRPPSDTEQARRVAWGREWGGMISAFWKAQHAKEGKR